MKPESDQTVFALGIPEIAKRSVEFLTVILACSYALGFLIVNSYLMSFGYASAALFKIKYMSAGLLFIFIATLLGLYTYCIYWATQPMPNAEPISWEQSWRTLLYASLGAVLVLFSLLVTIVHKEMWAMGKYKWVFWVIWSAGMAISILQNGKWKWRRAVWLEKFGGLPYVFFVVAFLLSWFDIQALAFIPFLSYSTWLLIEFFVSDEPLKERFRTWPISVIANIATISVMLLSSLVWYALHFYPFVEPQFGGGLPPTVRVILSEKVNLPPRLGDSPMVTKLLDRAGLVDSSDHEYLLLLRTDDDPDYRLILQLNRDHVDSLVYLK